MGGGDGVETPQGTTTPSLTMFQQQCCGVVGAMPLQVTSCCVGRPPFGNPCHFHQHHCAHHQHHPCDQPYQVPFVELSESGFSRKRRHGMQKSDSPSYRGDFEIED